MAWASPPWPGLYHSMGRYSEAEPLYRRSLAIREQQLGADHPYTASSLNNLAGLYYSMGQFIAYRLALSELEPDRHLFSDSTCRVC